ncbi:MAG: cytochrome c [Bacteroidetes bacterium]|nr:cytochrome c [Bacteroidota bacterium]
MTFFRKITSLNILVFFISCGPRSGVHHEEKKEELVGSCGTVSETGTYASYSPDGEKLFKLNCAVCHAAHADQKLTGPGLKGIAYRVPQPADQWFLKYVLNNEKVFKSGDAYAAKLRGEYKDTPMTIFEGQLEEADIMAIYKYLAGPPASSNAIP